jgi:hypothetical protein
VTELDRTWAESQIEAMAEGSLSAEAEHRMLAAMDRDGALAQRVEQARALRQALRGLSGAPVPRGLWRRLWRIPTADRPRWGIWMPAGVLATAVVAALAISVLLNTQTPVPEDQAQAAVEDFAVAMAYLQKSAVMASNEMSETIGSGMAGALEMSRGMLDRTAREGVKGEDNDD